MYRLAQPLPHQGSTTFGMRLERWRRLTFNWVGQTCEGNSMLILARTVLWLCLFVFLPHSAMAAIDGPNAYLKGINIISYDLIVEKNCWREGLQY
jgi:hypothetical protein